MHQSMCIQGEEGRGGGGGKKKKPPPIPPPPPSPPPPPLYSLRVCTLSGTLTGMIFVTFNISASHIIPMFVKGPPDITFCFQFHVHLSCGSEIISHNPYNTFTPSNYVTICQIHNPLLRFNQCLNVVTFVLHKGPSIIVNVKLSVQNVDSVHFQDFSPFFLSFLIHLKNVGINF